jgi:2-polyprenyl-3-methyl-5-hydroxy-6-metoxy-1,4-benzoquinol methylase
MKHSISNDAYDVLADAYAAQADTKPHNAYYERPATMSLIEEVDGRNILDAGCGPGVYSKWLLDRGAQVVAIDANGCSNRCKQKNAVTCPQTYCE